MVFNIKVRYLKCPICGDAMQREEGCEDFWVCKKCEKLLFIKIMPLKLVDGLLGEFN